MSNINLQSPVVSVKVEYYDEIRRFSICSTSKEPYTLTTLFQDLNKIFGTKLSAPLDSRTHDLFLKNKTDNSWVRLDNNFDKVVLSSNGMIYLKIADKNSKESVPRSQASPKPTSSQPGSSDPMGLLSAMFSQYTNNHSMPQTSPTNNNNQCNDTSCQCDCKTEKKQSPANPTLSVEWPKLSSPLTSIKSRYEVVVIGSGYGASIAACRMARAGKQVCVLEKGKEKVPGEYPNTIKGLQPELQLTLPDGSVFGNPIGFFDFTLSTNTIVWKGCGLGGGSLVNSNVSIRPDPRIYNNWPTAIQQDMQSLEQGFQMAEEMLCPNPYPHQATRPLVKLDQLETASTGLGGKFYPAHVNVTFDDRVNDQGYFQPSCTLCGDCNSGCNYGAKNTLLMNYLPDAHSHGAEMYCSVMVKYLTRNTDSSWTIHCWNMEDTANPVEFTVIADNVFVGAGSLGSTEILLRSKANGLPTSDCTGLGFGADGDFFGFSFNGPENIDSVGYGPNAPVDMYEKEGPVGPCISGVIDLRSPDKPLTEGNIMEDMTVPGIFARLVSIALPALATIYGTDTTKGQNEIEKMLRIIQCLVEGPYTGSMRNTLLIGGMGHDNQDGVMYLSDDRLCISWPNAIDDTRESELSAALLAAVTNLQGNYIKNFLAEPAWFMKNFPKIAACVHPLGGCMMADTGATGVVNHKGQVFTSTSSGVNDVYTNLYVCDGAIIPSSIGVNPLFTISAAAERICQIAAQDKGWKIDMKQTRSQKIKNLKKLNW